MSGFIDNALPFAAFVAFGVAWAAGHYLTSGGPHHG